MKSDNIPLGHVDTPTSEEVPLPLPPTHSLDEMTTLERRVLYDYAVEVSVELCGLEPWSGVCALE